MGNIILVTGGARSGKSCFAQELAMRLERIGNEGECSAGGVGRVVYIATAEVRDEEMRRRVALHRRSRPETWLTVEAPAGLAEAIMRSRDNAGVILVDCLTVYLSNLILKVTGDLGDADNPEIDSSVEAGVIAEIERVIEAAESSGVPVIFVTNETGTGLVPPYRLGRVFRDLSGIVNQKVAAASKRVFMVVCGISFELRSVSVSASDVAASITRQSH